MSILTDPWFYSVAVPAVLIFGIAKGGFGGGLGVISVPLMALAISPVQAAAILLPILCLMDLVSLWAYRGQWVRSELKLLLPASVVGVIAGTLLFGYMSPGVVRLMLGVVAIAFTVHYVSHRLQHRDAEPKLYGPVIGAIAGSVAGFTSFVAHAGGPPLNMYLLRRGLNRTRFVGTSVVFFTITNYAKLIPYAWLGQLDAENLGTSLVLAPLAPIGIGIGYWLHLRASDRLFFSIVYVLLFLVGAKLTFDGMRELGLWSLL